MKKTLLGTVAAIAMSTGAYAQNGEVNGADYNSDANNRQWPFVGSIGFEGGMNYFDDFTAQEDSSGSFLRGDINFVYHKPGTRYAFAINGLYRNENLTGSENFDEMWAPANRWEAGAKLYKVLSRRARVGMFAAYGKENFEDDSEYPAVSQVVLGVEAQYLLDDDFLLFGQAGVGDSWGGNRSDINYNWGFGRGYIVRGGVTWFGCYNSAFTLDVELGGASDYTDDENTNAQFASISLYGETKLPVDMPLFLGYGFRHRAVDAIGYSSGQTETEGFLRLSWVWGAASPRDRWLDGDAIGNPVMPGRSAYHGIITYAN